MTWTRFRHHLYRMGTACAVIAAVAAFSLNASHALADAEHSVNVTNYSVTPTIPEGSSISINLQYSISPTNEQGMAGTTTHRLRSNSVTHNVSGPVPTSVITTDASDLVVSHTHNGSVQIVQNGTYTVSFNDDAPTRTVEESSYGLGTNVIDTSRNISGSATVIVTNVAPTIVSAELNGTNGDISVPEGTSVSAVMSSTDPGQDFQTFTIHGMSAGVGGNTPGSTRTSSSVDLSSLALDDGFFVIQYEVFDGDDTTIVTRNLTVTNTDPFITGTTGPSPDPVHFNDTAFMSVSVDDAGVLDFLTASWDFDGDLIPDFVDALGTGPQTSIAGFNYFAVFGVAPALPASNVPITVPVTVTIDDGDGGMVMHTFNVNVIPEPSSYVIAMIAMSAGLFWRVRRRRK